MAHQLTDFNDYKEGPVGCILLCVDEKALCDVYKQGSTKSNITFVVNRYGDIISYPEGNYGERSIFAGEEKKERSKKEIEQAAQKFVEDNRYPQGASLSVRSKGVQNQNFYVVNVRDLNYVLKDLHNLTFLIVLVGLLAGVICVLIAVSFSKEMDRSVKPILNAMDLSLIHI